MSVTGAEPVQYLLGVVLSWLHLTAAMEGDMEQKKDDIEQLIHELETREGRLKSQVPNNRQDILNFQQA